MVCHLATSVAFPVSRRPLEREMDGGAQRRFCELVLNALLCRNFDVLDLA